MDAPETFRIKHPFHPLVGQELVFVEKRAIFGRLRVYYHDSDSRLRSVPYAFTDLRPVDPYVSVSAGRSLFRPRDLLDLVELITTLRVEQTKDEAQKHV